MTDEREQVKETLRRLALGEEEGGGRVLASRVAAARRWEMLTRDEAEPPQPVDSPLDFPVDEGGCFCPMTPPWWPLWRTRPCHDYESGDEREAAAIASWEEQGGRLEWERRGRPFPRSLWERDRSAWTRALTELDG